MKWLVNSFDEDGKPGPSTILSLAPTVDKQNLRWIFSQWAANQPPSGKWKFQLAKNLENGEIVK